eukprot:356238-Chlamydomonas_euryale.AAC.4
MCSAITACWTQPHNSSLLDTTTQFQPAGRNCRVTARQLLTARVLARARRRSPQTSANSPRRSLRQAMSTSVITGQSLWEAQRHAHFGRQVPRVTEPSAVVQAPESITRSAWDGVHVVQGHAVAAATAAAAPLPQAE